MKRRQRRTPLWAAAVGVALSTSACSAPQRAGEGAGDLAGVQRMVRAAAERQSRREVATETPAMVAQRLRARAEARVAACRDGLDVRPFEADIVGRYQLQGRISDLSMTRWLELLTTRAARLAAARACIRESEGRDAAIPPPDQLLPVLQRATLGLLLVLRGAAQRWADALDGSRDATSARWFRALQADPTPLLPQDGPWAKSVSATHRFVVLDVQVVQPAPIPVVDERGRVLARETPLTVIVRPEPPIGALQGLCLHRFATEVQPLRGRGHLRVWPQWRVAACPTTTPPI